jgi:hypothetical protein
MPRLCIFLSVLLFTISCEAPVMPLPGVTGKAGELVVVMDQNLWKGVAGDTVFNTLTQHVYGLPQPEPMFNVVHIRSDAFTKIFQTHRNIVVANIGEGIQKRIELKTDVWATPQVVVEISAPNVDEFMEIFGSNANRIIGHVLNMEQSRILKSYDAQLNQGVVLALEEQFALKLTIPNGYDIVASDEDFVWVRHEDKEIIQSVLVYSVPYEKENTFSKEGMVEVMDRFAKAHVPGPDEGTYMTTYTEYPPQLSESVISDKYASRLVGLWNVEGALMGGPFVSYAFLDSSGKRVIYLHGFVFAPSKDKRNYLRQVDAILNSAQLR